MLTLILVLMLPFQSNPITLNKTITFEPELVPEKLHSYVVVFWTGQNSNSSEIWKTFPMCGTVINEHYVLTQAHIFKNPDYEKINWYIAGMGLNEISVVNMTKKVVQAIHVHPKFQENDTFQVNNLALAQTKQSLGTPEVVVSWNVKYSDNTKLYPERLQTMRRMYIIYWSVESNGTTLKKRLMHVLPNKLKTSKLNCPEEQEGFYCIGVEKPVNVFPCGDNTIALGAPIMVNNELHAILVGPYQKKCNLVGFKGDENLIGTAVLNLKRLPETHENLLVARRFMKEIINGRKIYLVREVDDGSSSSLNATNATNVKKISVIKHYDSCYLSGEKGKGVRLVFSLIFIFVIELL